MLEHTSYFHRKLKGAKSIELYITCDTTKDFVEMTGERIVGEFHKLM